MVHFLGRNWRKLLHVFHRNRFERELEEEIDFHLRLKQADCHGLSSAEAHTEGRRAMGNVTLAKEESRDMWAFQFMEQMIHDVRYAFRVFRKNPGFTLVAVLSLALGIAGNTAIFTIINALLIRPLPYPQPSRLVRITGLHPKALLQRFQQQLRSIDVALVGPASEFNLTGRGPAARVTGSEVSANFFSVLGSPIERGRAFEPGENRPGSDGVVIISHDLWQKQLNSDPNAIGQTITLAGVNRRIVGVTPPAFS